MKSNNIKDVTFMITQKSIKFDFHSYDCSCDLQIVDEIESLKSIYFDFWFHDQSCIYKNVHEIESYEYSRSKVTNTVGAAYCDHFVPNQIWLTEWSQLPFYIAGVARLF